MKKQIQEVLDIWCWATFTDGRFVITRFCGDEVLAKVSAEELYRNSFPQYRPRDVFEGLEFLVPGGRYTIPGERDKRVPQYYAHSENKPRGYLRIVEWGVVAIALRVNRKAYEGIVERRTSGRR